MSKLGNNLEFQLKEAGLRLNHFEFEYYALEKRKKELEKIALNILNAFEDDRKFALHMRELTEYFRQENQHNEK